MATCKTCQLAIPEGAPVCPFCGGKTAYLGLRQLLVVAGGIFGFVALAYMIFGGKR